MPVSREQVYEMLTKEDRYAQGWSGKDGNRKKDNRVSAHTGLPFSMMDWLVFAEKYLNEAKLAYANYTPDQGAVRIRLLKAASLLVTALEEHGQEKDLERLAGVSSTKFPILSGGLATLEFFEKSGHELPGALKNEELKNPQGNK